MRVWRVQAWIRAVASGVWLLLLVQQFSTVHFVRLGQMDASEVRLGWAMLAAFAAGTGLFAFRSFIAVSSESVTLQGPVRRVVLARSDVVGVEPTEWGLKFALRDGTSRTSLVCQATWSAGEPPWFDLAEAVTGVRPAEDQGFPES